MTRAIIAVLTLAGTWAFFGSFPGIAEEGQIKGATKIIMEEKLKNSQKLLEGIALADFIKISRGAEELIQLTKTEEWFVYKTPKYELFSNEFQRAAEGVIAKAKDKNIDGVTLAYFELTMSCVRCHTYVREIRKASLPVDRPAMGLHP